MRDLLKLFLIAVVITLTVLVVPNIAKSNETSIGIRVPLDFESSNIRTWNEIGSFIKTTNYHTYVIEWKGYGGRVDMAHRFIQDLREAEAQGKVIIIHIIGLSASMHAIVPCYATRVVKDDTLLYHADGIFRMRVSRQYSEIDGDLSVCISYGLMTETDRTKLWEGFEVWKNVDGTVYNPDPRVLWK